MWTQGIRGLSVCVRVTVTENVWGTEGGRRGRVNGNHQSQRSSDTQQESLSLVYTCCYTLVHTWAGAHWFGKHNLGGCCCCFKASQRVHKLSWIFMSMNLACCFIHAGYEHNSERDSERGGEKDRKRNTGRKREREREVKGRERGKKTRWKWAEWPGKRNTRKESVIKTTADLFTLCATHSN